MLWQCSSHIADPIQNMDTKSGGQADRGAMNSPKKRRNEACAILLYNVDLVDRKGNKDKARTLHFHDELMFMTINGFHSPWQDMELNGGGQNYEFS